VIEFFLGVIAVSVLAMAIGQVVAVVVATRAMRQVGERVGALEATLRPIVDNMQRITDDTARATAIAAAQVERAERLLDDVVRRVEETLTALQDTILRPAQNGWAALQSVRDVMRAFFDRGNYRSRPRGHGPSPAAAEDDASFIG
jgi:uncharacterized protein YoxC